MSIRGGFLEQLFCCGPPPYPRWPQTEAPRCPEAPLCILLPAVVRQCGRRVYSVRGAAWESLHGAVPGRRVNERDTTRVAAPVTQTRRFPRGKWRATTDRRHPSSRRVTSPRLIYPPRVGHRLTVVSQISVTLDVRSWCVTWVNMIIT